MIQKAVYSLDVAAQAGGVQGDHAAGVVPVDGSPRFQQKLQDFLVVASGGEYERSVLVVVLFFQISSTRDQEVHGLEVAKHHSPVEGRVSGHVLDVEAGELVALEEVGDVEEALDDGDEEGRVLVGVLQVQDVPQVLVG